jgi:hypothetical protein
MSRIRPFRSAKGNLPGRATCYEQEAAIRLNAESKTETTQEVAAAKAGMDVRTARRYPTRHAEMTF